MRTQIQRAARNHDRRRRRGCTSKKRYLSQDTAARMAAALSIFRDRALSPYRCEFCDGYHLTTHPK